MGQCPGKKWHRYRPEPGHLNVEVCIDCGHCKRERELKMEGNLNIRGFHPATITLIKEAAAARGMTIAKYVESLVALHVLCRTMADDGRDSIDADHLKGELENLGLETVSR